MISARIILPLAGAASLMFACGPWSVGSQSERGRRHTSVAKGDPIANALEVSVDRGVKFAFTVTNNSRRNVEIRFPDGLTHDFVVLDSLGRQVWRWSEGRMFTSVVRTKLMKSGNALTFANSWDAPPARGKYVAVATLRSSNHPVRTQVAFTLP